MQFDIRMQYCDAIDQSHHGRPLILTQVQTGGPGHPRYVIDRNWLAWAYQHWTTAGIAQFLQVGQSVIRNALLEYGIAQDQPSLFASASSSVSSHHLDLPDTSGNEDISEPTGDDLLEPILPSHTELAATAEPRVVSYTGPLSTLSNDELDNLIQQLRQQFIRAGITILDGMLRRLGHRIPCEQIWESLLHIDPVW